MKTKISLIIAVVIVLSLSGMAGANLVNSNSKLEDGIEYYIQTDKAVYNLGENVQMLYRVTNLTDVSVNLGTLLPDPPDNYDLRIMQGNAQVWWYPYTAITAVIRDFILQPLETKEFQTTWDMMNDNGTPFQEYDDFLVSPGSYNIVGEVALSFGYERVPVSVSIEIIPEHVVHAKIDIDPDTINMASKGEWVNCKIRLGEDYNAADVNSYTVLLQNEVQAEWIWFNEKQNVVMAKFSRSELVGILEPGEVELTVSGQLVDGTTFEGTDTIKVIDKGRLRGRRVNSNSKVEDGIEYYIQTDKAVYNLGENVEMLYRLTNLGDEDVMFLFGVGPLSDRVDYMVEQDGERIWDNLERPVTFGVTSFTLGPSESKDFTLSWGMTDFSGNQIVPGNYNVTGVLDYDPSNERYVPVSVQIKIIPRKKKR